MPEAPWQRLEQLFAAAVELPAAARRAFLDAAAGNDPALRNEVLSLLAVHETEGGILDRSPLPQGPAPGPAAPPEPRLGPWALAELIGRGGAGEVYAARRADGAFEQRVAIKLLRREAVAEIERFEAERRILARLEHPGIARLIDGGVAADGRPYAVLEHVEGTDLCTYCQTHHLDLEARLALFEQVLEAVAYAHRHLVIHRDLKPGNILVTADGRVKLLDFGIAKLLAPAAPELTRDAVTFAPLTLGYAAPEQATGDAVTTATDVYALGVVLFEVLSGSRPWRDAELPIAHAVRWLLEESPPAASTVAQLPEVPARRLAGDLDAILAKCLRKEPGSRYATVEALRSDLERFRRLEPVEAREKARLYVARRFLARHRWEVASAAALVLSLAAGLAGFAWQARRAALERDAAQHAAAREQAVRDHLVGLFRGSLAAGNGQAGEEPLTAKAMLDRSAGRVIEGYKDDPQLAGQVVETLADLYAALGDVEGQVPLLEGFLAAASPKTGGEPGSESDPRAVALARQKLANLELVKGNGERAAELLAAAEEVWQQDPARFREERLEGLLVRGQLERSRGELEASIATYGEAIEARLALSGRVNRETANLYNSLAITLTAANRIEPALAAHQEALAILEALGRGEDLEALVMRANTGALALRNGRRREAEEILGEMARRQQTAGGDSAPLAAALGLYGVALSQRGDPGAAAILAQARAMAERYSGAASPLSLQNRLFQAEALALGGDLATARRDLAEALALCRAKFGPENALTLRLGLALARLALSAGEPQKAEREARALLPALAQLRGPSAAFLAQGQMVVGEALLREGRAAEAVPLLGQAVAQREQLLWNGSWELAQARARWGEARLAAGDAGGREPLTAALPALKAELGPDHPETRRAEAALAAASR